MTGPNDQAKQEHDDYWQAVNDVAEAVVAELEDTDEDQDESLTRLVHEATDQHDCVIRDDLQIQTLQHSQHSVCSVVQRHVAGTPISSQRQLSVCCLCG